MDAHTQCIAPKCAVKSNCIKTRYSVITNDAHLSCRHLCVLVAPAFWSMAVWTLLHNVCWPSVTLRAALYCAWSTPPTSCLPAWGMGPWWCMDEVKRVRSCQGCLPLVSREPNGKWPSWDLFHWASFIHIYCICMPYVGKDFVIFRRNVFDCLCLKYSLYKMYHILLDEWDPSECVYSMYVSAYTAIQCFLSLKSLCKPSAEKHSYRGRIY